MNEAEFRRFASELFDVRRSARTLAKFEELRRHHLEHTTKPQYRSPEEKEVKPKPPEQVPVDIDTTQVSADLVALDVRLIEAHRAARERASRGGIVFLPPASYDVQVQLPTVPTQCARCSKRPRVEDHVDCAVCLATARAEVE